MVVEVRHKFIKPILDGIKIHFLTRRGVWFKGKEMHFYDNNRYKTRSHFHKAFCDGYQFIEMNPYEYRVRVRNNASTTWAELPQSTIDDLARNEGWESTNDFWRWYNKGLFIGRIIHWTSFRYPGT